MYKINNLNNTDVDIAISPTPLVDGFSEQLCQIEFIAVASPTHKLHSLNRTLSSEDLKSHRQVVVRDSAQFNKHDAGWLGANQRWTVSHLTTSIDMICNGFGFAWLPLSSIQEQLKRGQLKPLSLIHSSKRTMQLHLIFKDHDSLGPAASAFIEELKQQSTS